MAQIQGMNGKISSSVADQAGQVHNIWIMHEKCRSSRRNADQADKIIYCKLRMAKSVQNYKLIIKTIKTTPKYQTNISDIVESTTMSVEFFIRYLYFFYFHSS